MSADAQALVRQLTENPEVLESMQHMLTLLRSNPPRSAPGNTSAATSQRARPPRTGYQDRGEGYGQEDREEEDEMDGREFGGPRGFAYSTTERPRSRVRGNGDATVAAAASNTQPQRSYTRYTEAEEATVAVARSHSNASRHRRTASPQATLTESDSRRRTISAADRLPRRSSPLPPTAAQLSGRTAKDTLTAAAAASSSSSSTAAAAAEAARQLAEAQRRIADLERELSRTAQRVQQLSDVVQKQKDDLQEAQDRHQLELEETRHAYDAVVRRKDEVQEEALRQMMKSRQLMVSAAKYEAVVAAKKREKENYARYMEGKEEGEKQQQQQQQRTSAGLTASAAAVNTRTSSRAFGGTVKRERADDGIDDGYTAANAQAATSQGLNVPPSKRTASDSWGTPASRGRARPHGDAAAVPQQSPQQQQQQWVYNSAGKSYSIPVYTKTESPEFITSPTPVGKTSTALLSNGRTASRSTRKRRTPRTPSLTHADRITAAAAPPSHSPASSTGYPNDGSGPSPRGLPGTASIKLDSPTPANSRLWKGGRSATASRTPPPSSAVGANPPPAPPLPLGKAAAAGGGAVGGQPRPPLVQRTAGRLPGPTAADAMAATHAPARAVPNTRSGTSSVVADGPTRSPSPVNPKRGYAGPRRFVFTGLKEGEPQRLADAIRSVGEDAAVMPSELDEVPPKATTHIVLRGTPRSVKALCGVVSGKWLVSPDYIENSAESGFWLDEMEEGGMRVYPPPLQGQRFLLTVEHSGIRSKLAQVIEYGGGEVMPATSGKLAQDVVVFTSGDDLLRYATEGQM